MNDVSKVTVPLLFDITKTTLAFFSDGCAMRILSVSDV